MTNYNEKLDEILDKFFEVPYPDYNMGILPDEDGYNAVQERRNYEESYARDEAKQAITSLIKELVAEAKPLYYASPDKSEHQDGFNTCIHLYEQNLLKALSKETSQETQDD